MDDGAVGIDDGTEVEGWHVGIVEGREVGWL
jgi:hypothetical protein